MEVYKFQLRNETKLPKDLIIEPYHFVEALESNDVVEIHFSSAAVLENKNPFSINVMEHTFVLWIEWNMSEPANRSITTFVNNIERFKFEW